MRFEWDEAKSRANRAKHGISFEEVLTIFDGPVLTAVDRRWDYGEERLVSLGRLGGRFTTVVVVHSGARGRHANHLGPKATRTATQRYYEHLEEAN